MTIAGESGFLMENEASCLPCTPEEEKQTIKELMENDSLTMKEGSLFYVLSNRWFMEWRKYTGQAADDFLIDENSIDPQLSNGNHTTLGVVDFLIEVDSNGNCVGEGRDDFSKHEQSNGSQISNGILSAAAARPGQIDNSDLVIDGSDSRGDDLELKRTLQEGTDYILISQDVWKKLYDWYKGGPALPRKVISQGVSHKTYVVEVYPLSLQLTDVRDDKKHVIQISKKASLRELYNMVSMLLGLEVEKFRVWDFFNKKKHSILVATDQTLEETHLQMDQEILVEVEPLGFWPSGSGVDSTGNGLALVPVEPLRSPISIAGGPTLSNGYSTGYVSNFSEGNSLLSPTMDVDDGYNLRKVASGDRGLAGLQNLGNTCFMNSAIQCLAHTPPLAEYFLQDYSNEINKLNPIGLQGELAVAFGDLLRKLWSSGRVPVPPRVFKGKLARFAPQFSGYNQHDSHELLAFLLDGLHEDLNRVKFKPYIEIKDANGRPDEEVADECWGCHKARNNSVIVDVCQGQYKSTLVCPVCSKVSVTFDPFMYLSLPLPSTATRSMMITVFYGDGSAPPSKVSVSVVKNGCYKDLFEALGSACGLKNDEVLLLAEVYQHKVYRYLENPFEQLSNIKDHEHIVAYRLPKKQGGYTKLELIHRREECGTKRLVGTPLVTFITEVAENREDVQSAVRMVLDPFLKMNKCTSNGDHTSTEAGPASGSNVDGVVDTENHDDEMELDQLLEGIAPFNLSLADDEMGTSCSPIGNAPLFQPDNLTRVLLDWSNKELGLYDISYLDDLPVVHTTGFTSKKIRQEAVSLFSCMEAFLKEEPLGPDDMWYCPTCKEHRQATKKLDLWRLPEILVVHLKRFSYSRFFKNKLDTFVDFPIQNLDLKDYVKSKAAPQSHLYELYAVSNHYGSLGGGHYSAYAKLIEENRWYHFDDSYVSSIGEDEIKSSAAYVLFYQRVGGKGANDSPQSHSSSG